ncbi:MAG: glutamyl-tRNA reductase, partial [Deltaproteobacteria bacterium]|nr:glutamyl-tRNA reductase [Deltaproteobacteria bacterium]
RVASSLDAMVVGEAQVLGQFKAAYQTAVEYNTVGPYLHKACHAAFRVAKRVRTETDVAALPVSIGSLAIDLAIEAYPDLSRANVLLIGAGEMSSLVANHLKDNGVEHIWIANRSHASAETLAHAVKATVVPFESWNVHMQTADIVVTSIGGGALIKKADVEAAISERDGNGLIIIDLAIPRNVESSAGKISGVKLYNIDDLQSLAEKNISARKESAAIAEKIVSEEATAAFQEIQQIKLAPMITNLHKKCASIMQTELAEFFKDHPHMADEEKESVQACVGTIVKKILHDPIRLAKEELARPGANGKEVASALQKIFQV